MPIRPELRHLYTTKEWRAYRLVLIQLAGGACQRCGVVPPTEEELLEAQTYDAQVVEATSQQLVLADWFPDRQPEPARIERPRIWGLNCAHVHHDPKDPTLVAVWCPSCHAAHDSTQRYAMTRRTRAEKVGQLWLLESIKEAPYAPWMVSRRVGKNQLRLEL